MKGKIPKDLNKYLENHTPIENIAMLKKNFYAKHGKNSQKYIEKVLKSKKEIKVSSEARQESMDKLVNDPNIQALMRKLAPVD